MKTVRYIQDYDITYDFVKLTNDVDIILDEIIKQLSITLGSYQFNPNIGNRLHTFVYEFSDNRTYYSILDEITRIVKNVGHNVQLDNIEVSRTSDNKGLVIDIYLTIKNINKKISVLATYEYTSVIGVE